MANAPTIQLPSDVIIEVGSIGITNSMLATFFTSIILIVLAFLIRRKAGIVPSRMQVAFEGIMQFMIDKMEMAFGSRERAMKFFPLLFTIFLFFLIANQITLIPFVESLFVKDGISLFRSPAADYSLPIILTATILVLSHILALAIRPLRHIGNFIKVEQFFKMKSIKELPGAFLDLFLGLLDIIGELAKLVSLATRLFGNMFAGSIIVAIIASLTVFTQYIVPMPFIILGMLSGVVQAFVFVMLGSIYLGSTLSALEPTQTSSSS